MLDSKKITTNCDQSLITLSPLIIRNIIDRFDDGTLAKLQGVQFQVKNVSGKTLVNLDAEINFYDSSSEFTGTDSDLRIEPLKPGSIHTFSLIFDEPEKAFRAELTIGAKKQKITDTIPFWLKIIILIGLAASPQIMRFFK